LCEGRGRARRRKTVERSWFTGEDEKLSDLSITQEGCSMEWGSLVCILMRVVGREIY
jgi:hypothetical protein